MNTDKFLRGAVILTMAGLMVKVIGSVNRILLSRLLGGEGIGLYQMAYPVYLLLLSVSAAGVPVAISIIVAEKAAKNDHYSARRIFRVSLVLMTAVGLLLALLLFGAAGWMTNSGLIADSRVYYGLIALTPAVFFSTVLACFRGFFQGYQLMTPTAVSQITEQFVRVTVMVLLAFYLLPKGLEYAAAGAAFGAVPGGLAGLAVLICFYVSYRKRWPLSENAGVPAESAFTVARRLILLALPVSCANILVPVTSSIDMFLVPNRLISSGIAVDEATALFGYLAGMAQPLLMMATIPTLSLAASLVPAISESFTLGDKENIEQKAATAMKLCCLVTLPAAVGMSAFAGPLSLLLYGTDKALVAIMHTGPAVWLLGMQQITTGVLQGIGRVSTPMINMLAGIAAKVAAVWVLTDAAHNIIGAAWATNINFALTAGLNIWVLHKCGISFRWSVIIKTAFAALFMGLAIHYGYPLLLTAAGNETASSLAALAAAAAVYVALVFGMGIIKKEDLKRVPLLKKYIKK
ncbi:MAG: polysaccharide biosynthesis protein [Phascolarctobacterium sp.]|nr:polysaccharide biosynthesis protein [Phascolarctobacterium sp.]